MLGCAGLGLGWAAPGWFELSLAALCSAGLGCSLLGWDGLLRVGLCVRLGCTMLG